MDEYNRSQIKDIKTKIIAMIAERQRLSGGEMNSSPSQYWADVCSSFDYMLALPEESYSKLRIHTYHLTGDSYLHYDSHRDPQVFRTATQLDMLTKDIPPKFVLNEPDGGIGFSYENGRFVNIDILRYQRVVNTLYRHGILSALSSNSKQQRSCVLEIGGGYGALAHHLSNVLGDVTYVIVDLPETLLFSASYLSLLNPNKKIYVYDTGDFSEFVGSGAARSYDFILIPNYRLHSLARWQFELAINTISFQEMTTHQVDEYLDFISQTCTGTLYAWNIESHMTASGIPSMPEMLSGRFEFIEVPPPRPKEKAKVKFVKALKSIAINLGLTNHASRVPPLGEYVYRGREYLCTPVRKNKL